MARRARPIARVRLARSVPRLLAVPLLLIAAGGAAAAAGLLAFGGAPGLGMAVAGGLLGLVGVLAAAVPLSTRVHVEESMVRVRWLFGRRAYLLTPGPLTRVHLRGPQASRLQSGPNLGWALGRALLRDEEEIHVVRLAPTESVILVPTAKGRLAIATSNEPHLIDALTRAARARAAREELATTPTLPEPPPEPTPVPAPAAAGVSDGELMTGIGRELYEERLARERATPAAPAAAVGAQDVPTSAATDAMPSAERRSRFRRPSWARRRPTMSAPAMPAMGSVSMPAVPGVRALPIRRPQPSWLLLLVPLAGAGAAWAVGLYLGDLPATGSNGARLTALALVLSGPATTIGAIMARTWWPRTVGVVVTSGLAASAFVARALLG